MKKKQRLGHVLLSNSGTVKAFDTDGNEVKITRHQREIFKKYKSSEFLENIEKEFGAPVQNVLDEWFFIKKIDDGSVIYELNK